MSALSTRRAWEPLVDDLPQLLVHDPPVPILGLLFPGWDTILPLVGPGPCLILAVFSGSNSAVCP